MELNFDKFAQQGVKPSIDPAVCVNQARQYGGDKANSLDRSNWLPYYGLFVMFRVLKRLH